MTKKSMTKKTTTSSYKIVLLYPSSEPIPKRRVVWDAWNVGEPNGGRRFTLSTHEPKMYDKLSQAIADVEVLRARQRSSAGLQINVVEVRTVVAEYVQF